MTTDEAACAVQSVMDSLCDEVVQCGHWLGNVVQDIIIRRSNGALFLTFGNFATFMYCQNIAT